MLAHEVLKYTCLSTEHARSYGWALNTSLEEGIRRTVEFSIETLKNAGLKDGRKKSRP